MFDDDNEIDEFFEGSPEYPRNNVTTYSVYPAPKPAKEQVVRGAVYRETRFGKEDTGHLYIGASIGNGEYRLISLSDGNRWSDDSQVDPQDFTRVTTGTRINIQVGG